MYPKNRPLFILIFLVLAMILIVPILASCGGESKEPITTPSPIPTETLTPMITPTAIYTPILTLTPSPTSPPTSTISLGALKGKLMGDKTQEPLAGAAIILGQVTGEAECTLQSDLIASVSEDGSFELADVAPGIYVVFYDPSGEVKGAWQGIDKLKVNYVLIGKPHKGLSSFITNELFNTLGGGDILIGHYSEKLNGKFEDGIIKSIDGSFALTSKKYGITIQFEDGEPIVLEVKAGETTYLEISAMVTDVTPPVISEVTVSNVSSSSATITWTTNEPATGQVEYGETDQYGASSPMEETDETLIATHSVILTGLKPDMMYHYQVKSNDVAANQASSNDSTFKTQPVIWSDGKFELILDKVERTDVLPPEFPDYVVAYPPLRDGYNYVVAYLSITSKEWGVRVSIANEKSILVDADGIEYKDLNSLWVIGTEGGKYAWPNRAPVTLLFTVPEAARLTQLRFIYSFHESEDEQPWPEGQIDVIL